MKVSDYYKGVDPLVISLYEEILYLRSLLNSDENPQQLCRSRWVDVSSWRSSNFVEMFKQLYEIVFKESYLDEYRSISYPASQITRMLQKENIDLSVYYSYVRYLFYDDPFLKTGTRPLMHWLWNSKMFFVFLSRRRNTKPSERVVVDKLELSSYDKDAIRELGLSDD